MNEFHDNLWAPWRMAYIAGPAIHDDAACFLCDYLARPDRDAESLVVWRTPTTVVVMNRFPYTNGHLLIAPAAHKADLDDLSALEMRDLWHHTGQAKRLLAAVLKPQGFNIGVNLGRCAGAGLPGHVHIHVVPRWSGDTNFMAVLGDVRVIPQALDALYTRLVAVAAELGLLRPPEATP